MIYELDGSQAPREGSREHWERYRRAAQERPDLVQDLETAIRAVLDNEVGRTGVVNSSWLGSRVLDGFPGRADWDHYVPDAGASGSLFGMIMWTVMWDDSRAWATTMTNNPNATDPQRVYWLR